ncbi:thymidylate kinase [Rosenbergiella australiborealis]|uniref:Thymidylate kinase n=1 Tax=Rosenbergiella australiborealis TaxID=1544696 RepID=A0ABS5T745_9GAMM|nr:thymidylate kinase [Rosenbergiella australiborealis]MBT0728198.1 thymidylate kinase [Rosenbergiella australiborealis]
MYTKSTPVIAVIGSDGSGKSTVCEHLVGTLSKYGPASYVHLGKQAGNVGRAAANLPFIGRSVGKKIEKTRVKVDKTHHTVLSSLVVGIFVIRRVLRFRNMLKLRQQGRIILADRYPHLQVPGAYDSLTLPTTPSKNPFINWIAKRELKAFKWMTHHHPDLVIKLNVSLDVACARKPDHRREALSKKIEITPKLDFGGKKIINVDADQPLAQVLAQVDKSVEKFMDEQGFKKVIKGETL